MRKGHATGVADGVEEGCAVRDESCCSGRCHGVRVDAVQVGGSGGHRTQSWFSDS